MWPHSFYLELYIESRIAFTLGEHFTNWATFSVHFLSYSFVCETVLHRSPGWPQIHISSLSSTSQLLGLYIWLFSPWRDGSEVMNTWYSCRRLAQFPAPTLSSTQPPSSRDSSAIFWPLKVPGHTWCAWHTSRCARVHTHTHFGLVIIAQESTLPWYVWDLKIACGIFQYMRFCNFLFWLQWVSNPGFRACSASVLLLGNVPSLLLAFYFKTRSH